MNYTDTNILNSEIIPAIDCPLSGTHLIEASAGTGKTWTLTGILLRLLLEKNTPPERIVATTFTRAAAQEMQERLHKRLLDFDSVCQWAKGVLATTNLYAMTKGDRQALFDDNVIHIAPLADPINQYLLHWVLDKSPTELDKILRKLSLLSVSLDKIFVGTLDKLAQKWLTEFGAEIGINTKPTLIVTPDTLYYEIIHDELRRLHSAFYYNAPRLYHLLFSADDNAKPKLDLSLFSDVEKMLSNIQNSLNFLTADIDDFNDFGDLSKLTDDIIQEWEKELKDIVNSHQFKDFEIYYDKEFLSKKFGFEIRSNFAKYFETLPTILEKLQKNSLSGFSLLTDDETKFLKSVPDYLNNPAFKKNFEHNQAIWQSLPLHCIDDLYRFFDNYVNQLHARFQSAMIGYFATHLRKNLNQKLDENNQTTFSKQMADLSNALKGTKGQLLARHIRHLYPVALIDEVQDINGEQMALLQALYFNSSAKKDIFDDNKKTGFVLCVGDPKQAIYRFRGGDVANYNVLKKMGLNNQLTLTTNRRSNKTLIDNLNLWFDGDASNMGQEIQYRHILSDKSHHRLSWQASLNKQDDGQNDLKNYLPKSPLAILHFDEKIDKDMQKLQIARHINTILQTEHLTDDGKIKKIKPSDIAVLTRSRRDLEAIKIALAKYQIASTSTRDNSVFGSQACQELYELLVAVLDDDEPKLGAVLSGLFRFDLNTVISILKNDHQKLQLASYLKTIHKLWVSTGVGVALEWAFANWRFAAWRVWDDKVVVGDNDNLWQYLAYFDDGERYLTDIWQLLTLFAQSETNKAQEESPYQFLRQLKGLMVTKSDDEMHLQIALPSESAVSLMTIHGSKGLEFPIVYVLGLSSASKSREIGLYPYIQNDKRRLSPTKDKNKEQDYYKNQNDEENLEEEKRLAYVALTRASEQMFIIADDKTSRSKSVLQAWGYYPDDKHFELPTRLVGQIDVLKMNESTLIDTPYQPKDEQGIVIHYPAWRSVFKKTNFVGRHHTSFTGLSRLFDKVANTIDNRQSLSNTDFEEVADYLLEDQESNTVLPNEIVNIVNDVQDDNAIRNEFVRGADAGIFLHKVLEKWEGRFDEFGFLIDDTAKALKLPKIYQSPKNTQNNDRKIDKTVILSNYNRHNELIKWLTDVAKTPFVSGISLEQLNSKNRLSEFGFVLGTTNIVDLKKIGDIFKKYSPYPLYDFVDDNRIFEFLKGEIDLVYCHNHKYYVVDYKSNHLADNWQQYDNDLMIQAMNKSGYWLQAAIYQVALHRFLSLRITDYKGNESNYLGEVEYLFLRGVSPNNQNNKTGHLVWSIPIEMILELDEIL